MIDKQNILITQRALIVSADCKLLLYKRSGENNWELPGGIVKQNESLEEGISREIFEEVGSHIKTKQLYDVSEFMYCNFVHSNNLKKNVRFIVITYQISTESEPILKSSEHEKFEWFDKSDLRSIEIYANSKNAVSKWGGGK